MCRVAFVFGSRRLSDSGLVASALKGLLPSGCAVWSGGCRGADRFAVAWARAVGRPVREFPVSPAEWERFGPSAGPRRSAAVVSALPAGSLAVCFAPPGVAFPGRAALAAAGGVRSFLSAGSRAACALCLRAGVPVSVVWACGTVTKLKSNETTKKDPNHPSGDVVMPFGKHKGTTLKNVPLDYLQWLMKQDNPSGRNIKLFKAMLQHLEHRTGTDAPRDPHWRELEDVTPPSDGDEPDWPATTRTPTIPRDVDTVADHGSDEHRADSAASYYEEARDPDAVYRGPKGVTQPRYRRGDGDLGELPDKTGFPDDDEQCKSCGSTTSCNCTAEDRVAHAQETLTCTS